METIDLLMNLVMEAMHSEEEESHLRQKKQSRISI